MSSLIPRTPAIIDAIINAVYEQGSVADLRSISLTCSQLLPKCRKHLFACVSLTRPFGAEDVPSPATHLSVILDANPGIGHLIRELRFAIQLLDLHDVALPKLLLRLHQVQTLRLSTACGSWFDHTAKLRVSLTHLIQSPSLALLEISSFRNFPVSLFIPCTNLRHLDIFRLTFKDESSVEMPLDIPKLYPPTRLRSLRCSAHCTAGVSVLLRARRSETRLPIIDLSGVRCLGVRMQSEEEICTTRALIQATPHLQSLETFVAAPGSLDGLATMFHKTSFTTLTRLTFDLVSEYWYQDPLFGLCNELEILAEDNVLEELRINVFSPRTVIRTGEDWGLLDIVLSSPGAFRALRKVRVGIRVMLFNRLSVEIFEELKSVPTEQFPSLSTNPLIDFKFWVGVD